MATNLVIDPSKLGLGSVPAISQGASSPITSPGSGGSNLGAMQYKTSTSDNSTAGALLGGLLGMAMQNRANGTTKGTTSSSKIPTVTTLPKVTTGGTSTGGQSSSSGPTPHGLGTYIGGGNTGTVGGATFPVGTTQDQIDAEMGKTNGVSNYIIAGPGATGQVIAQPNLNISPSYNTSSGTSGGVGQGTSGLTEPSLTATAPTTQDPGTYFQDASGNIYDGSGNLYAVNNNGTYFVNQGNGQWMDATTGAYENASQLFGSSSTDTSNPIDTTTPIDTSGGGGYDPNAVDNSGVITSPIDFTSSDNGTPIFKQGGLATPLMKQGGSMQRFEIGGPVTADPNSTSGYSNSSGQAVDVNGNLVDSTGAIITSTDPTTSPSFLTTIQNLIKNNTGASGAVLGALVGQLLGSSSDSNQISTGVDMSKVGQIAPRTTTFGMGPAKSVPYSQYGTPTTGSNDYSSLFASLGAPSAVAPPTMTQSPLMSIKPPTPVDTGPVPPIDISGNPPITPPSVTQYVPPVTTTIGGLGRNQNQINEQNKKNNQSHYTYGQHADAIANLNQWGGRNQQRHGSQRMAEGGTPENDKLGIGVPVVSGRNDYRDGAPVMGAGDGQSDDIPALLADGEYVFSADVVAALGNGSNKAGAQNLDEMVRSIRERARSSNPTKLPPPAKSPLAYLKGAK